MSTLQLVASSEYANQVDDNLAFIGTGYYFIRIIPFGATNRNTYVFVVNTNTDYDEYEVDDNFSDSITTYTGSMNITPNLDDAFDVDIAAFKPQASVDYYVSLNNAPEDAQYALFFYDANMKTLGSFLSSGNESRWIGLTSGNTYYVQVYSYDGNFNPVTPYDITIVRVPPKAPVITADDYNVYVDGKPIEIRWVYNYQSSGVYPNPGYYSRHESTVLNSNGTSVIGTVFKCSFTGFNKEIKNGLYINVNYVNFWDYMHRFGNTSQPSGETERDYRDDSNAAYNKDYCHFIYNLDTGKMEDNLGSYPYAYYGKRYYLGKGEVIHSGPQYSRS